MSLLRSMPRFGCLPWTADGQRLKVGRSSCESGSRNTIFIHLFNNSKTIRVRITSDQYSFFHPLSERKTRCYTDVSRL